MVDRTIRRMRKLVIAGMLLTLGTFAWRASRDSPDAKLVFNRVWLDHLPRGETDRFHALIIGTDRPIGHFAEQTPWTGQWEGFRYDAAGGEGQLDLRFPASGKRERVTFKARRCDEGGFDYCLDVTGSSRGPTRYFSKKQWGRPNGDAIDPAILEQTIRSGS
jgi:hypothetical protein